ncbi:MAG: hypothetical protein JXO48_02280, partial [Deltaproteobacteria bacterium]|nr:hypothetical protein [Deltaproteobacteria bacterium]
MNTTWIRVLTIICSLCLFIGACENGSDDGRSAPTALTGTVNIETIKDRVRGPILVAITNTDDLIQIEEKPGDVIITTVRVDESDHSFSMDLVDTGLAAGDKVAIFAFVDNNNERGVPYPDPGDFVGIYAPEGKITFLYTLHGGVNEGIEIDITREVYDFDASVSGTVRSVETGEVTLVAYAGEITSSDFSSLDFDGVVGY